MAYGNPTLVGTMDLSTGNSQDIRGILDEIGCTISRSPLKDIISVLAGSIILFITCHCNNNIIHSQA